MPLLEKCDDVENCKTFAVYKIWFLTFLDSTVDDDFTECNRKK